MRLKPAQWLWIVGTILFFLAVVLDIVGVFQMPTLALVAIPIALLLVSQAVGPSLKELKGMNRRG